MQKIFNPRLVPALMAIAFSGSASAAGFQLLEQNASGLGNAYAGSAAVADNASTIYFNPAGMTQLQDREVSMGGTLVKTSFDFRRSGRPAARWPAAAMATMAAPSVLFRMPTCPGPCQKMSTLALAWVRRLA